MNIKIIGPSIDSIEAKKRNDRLAIYGKFLKDRHDNAVNSTLKYEPKIGITGPLLFNLEESYNTGINKTGIINKMCIPGKYHIYVYVTNSGNRYVGSSEDIKCRLYGHLCTSYEQIRSIIIFVLEKYEDMVNLEKQMIKDLKPELNKGLYPGRSTMRSLNPNVCAKGQYRPI